jgi:hypothetical protein
MAADTLFDTGIVVARAAVVWYVRAADVDGDGRTDIVYSSEAENSLSWLQGLGGGEFYTQPRHICTSCAGANDFLMHDVDVDGDLDAVVSSQVRVPVAGCGSSIHARGSLDRRHTSHHACLFSREPALSCITAFCCTAQFDNTVSWFENVGAGESETYFSPTRTIISTVSEKPTSLTLADLNGDGAEDLVSGWRGNAFHWQPRRIAAVVVAESGSDLECLTSSGQRCVVFPGCCKRAGV